MVTKSNKTLDELFHDTLKISITRRRKFSLASQDGQGGAVAAAESGLRKT
jgi:hypothetical protein